MEVKEYAASHYRDDGEERQQLRAPGTSLSTGPRLLQLLKQSTSCYMLETKSCEAFLDCLPWPWAASSGHLKGNRQPWISISKPPLRTSAQQYTAFGKRKNNRQHLKKTQIAFFASQLHHLSRSSKEVSGSLQTTGKLYSAHFHLGHVGDEERTPNSSWIAHAEIVSVL